MDQQTRVTIGTNQGTTWTEDALVQIAVRRTLMYQHAQPTNRAEKAIGFSLEVEDASEVDHEDFMRGVNAKFGPRCFFCNLEGHFKSDCSHFGDADADIKHPRHEEALSGVKASKAHLLSEAEARRKEKPQELAAQKMQAVTEEMREPEPVAAADDFKNGYRVAARDDLKSW